MKEFLATIGLFLTGFVFAMSIWFIAVSFMAWLTMIGWNIVIVGIMELSRPIVFWEAFAVYLVVAFIANLFRSSKD